MSKRNRNKNEVKDLKPTEDQTQTENSEAEEPTEKIVEKKNPGKVVEFLTHHKKGLIIGGVGVLAAIGAFFSGRANGSDLTYMDMLSDESEGSNDKEEETDEDEAEDEADEEE